MEKTSIEESINAVMIIIGYLACIFGVCYYLDHRNDPKVRESNPIQKIREGDSIYVFSRQLDTVVYDPEEYDPPERPY